MQCTNCSFVVSPGEAAQQGGVCPNCERPYRDQPTPLNSEMEMRNMPEPGMEDSGGNPLQEGILGDFQNRGVRDEAFSSTDPEFVLQDVILPDPDSIREDKEQMEKQADFMDTLGDIGEVAAPIAGGTAGFLVGGPAGAAVGAGLAGGGMEALQGGDIGDIAQTGLTDAALGGIGGIGGAALKAGTAADAAAAGSTRGGIGSLMKSAWGKVPTDKIKNAYMMHSVMNDASQATQPMAQPAPQMMPSAPPPASIYSAVETPSSHGEIPSNDTEDPEQVDFHEKNDGEKDGLQSGPGINDIGGSDLGPDDIFSPDSGALSSFADLLPKILEYALSDQSAAGDPDMEELHQKLEAEKPGYMNSANDDHGHALVVTLMKGGSDGDDTLQDNDQPHDPISEHEATALRPGLGNICARCGSTVDPSSTNCPQCGSGNPQHGALGDPNMTTPVAQAEGLPAVAHTAAELTQGPNTDQQKAQVATLLQEEGRGEEVPTMLLEPWNYANELAQITQNEEPPEEIGQEGPPPPVPPSQPGEMPMPGMAPPGAETGPQMMAAVRKYAGSVDGFCEACPKCGSHTTGYIDYEEGDAGCKTCGNKWKAPKMIEHSGAAEDMAAAPFEPELSQDQPEGEQEQTGSLSWTDESGAPLTVGQTYDMYSANYDIPDRITITAVKPDVVEYTINGEYGLSHQSELTHEESSVEGVNFVPAESEVEPAPEEAQGAQPEPSPGDQTDLSTPHEMMASTRRSMDDINGPYGPNVVGPEVPNEPGAPRQDYLKMAQGIYEKLIGEGVQDQIAKEQATEIVNQMRGRDLADEQALQAMPETTHPLGPQTGSVENRMGTAPPLRMNSHDVAMAEYNPQVANFFDDAPPSEHIESSVLDNGETGPAWLMEGSSRMAGAHLSPWEQRGYIDEIGDARNADKLQLNGTHYETDNLSDAFLFGDLGL